MDIRIIQVGTIRLVVVANLLPEGTTIGLFPAPEAVSPAAPAALPVSMQLLTDNTLSPLTADDLLPVLAHFYPTIPPAILRLGWLNGSPFLGMPTSQWPSGVYHFPGTEGAAPLSVLPTTSLVTAPFLAQQNSFTLASVVPSSHQPTLAPQTATLPTSPAVSYSSMPAATHETQSTSTLSFGDLDLSAVNPGLFVTSGALMQQYQDEDPNRFLNRIVAITEVLDPATVAPQASSSSAPTADPSQATAAEAIMPSLEPSRRATRVSPPVEAAHPRPRTPGSRPKKRSSSTKEGGSRHKHKPTSDTRRVVSRSSTSEAHSGHDATPQRPRSSDSHHSRSDPLLSNTSTPRTSTGSRARRHPLPGASPQVISSENSGEEEDTPDQ